MVAAARAVGVVVDASDAVLVEVLARRAVGLDIAGRADVVGGDGVAEGREYASAGDVGDRGRLDGHAVEVGRLAHVGRGGVPFKRRTGRSRQRAPALVTVEDASVLMIEHACFDRRIDRRLHFCGIRPNVFQVHVVAVRADAESVFLEIEVHRTGERIGDHEWRRSQVVHLHVGVDAAFEVAVAREHSGDG